MNPANNIRNLYAIYTYFRKDIETQKSSKLTLD
jgi:hypothetical protein